MPETPYPFETLDMWIRRRLRMCLWKQWKTGRNRARCLRALGASEEMVRAGVGSSNWCIAVAD